MSRFPVSWLLIATVALTGLAACAAPAPAAPTAPDVVQAPLKVLATETFLADIAQNVAGDRLKVDSLVPIGVDPHVFEPTPQDVARINQSQVLIVNGAGFESWLEKVLQNAGGTRTLIEAAAGLVMRQPAAGEVAHEAMAAHEHEGDHAHDDHSVESHAAMVCEQLAGKTAEETVQAGADGSSAVALHHEHEGEVEHGHGREPLILALNPQADGSFAGYVLFEAEAEEGYAFTAAEGEIVVTTAAGEPVAVVQELPLDCGGMTQGRIFKLTPGKYIVALTGFKGATTPFSAGPVHAHEEAMDEHAGEHVHEDEHAHHHHEGDPHFWLDPLLVIKYAENIRDGLTQADPAGKEIYAANAAAYIAKLQELDAWIKAQVATIPPERRLLVTNHESFGYFADRYGFTIVGTVIPSVSTGASPSAQEMAALIEHIKEHAAPAIFLETGTNPQLARQIAQEAGIKVVTELYTHSITDASGPAPTYIDMM
ncbi:MAG: metal ABC transporter substrate-binding protein, partial [Anaerolineae bacterium]